MFSESHPKRDRILAVDDIPDNLTIAQTILEYEGYEVNLVADGKTALEMIEQSPPDLVLLDVMMPDMDGYEVTYRIRQNTKLPYIPILLITASNQSNVVKGLDAGADEFIRKPVEIDELLARVRTLLRLKKSIDERDRTAHLREDFVSRFTHDLRTPLVAANRVLKLMQQGSFFELSAELDELLNGMISSNNDLLQMVNNLLEVYCHEAGCKNLELESFDIQHLVHEVVQELSPLALEKGLPLNLNSQIQDLILVGDRIELRRVLTNLVGNGIKFTDVGHIEVRLGIDETCLSSGTKTSYNPQLLIEIEDTGSGISPEEQATLFERFRKGKSGRSGNGLGLYLAKRIIAAHHGKIELSSELGRGSLFKIHLPLEQSEDVLEQSL
jgi:signal transduction histidine kinase